MKDFNLEKFIDENCTKCGSQRCNPREQEWITGCKKYQELMNNDGQNNQEDAPDKEKSMEDKIYLATVQWQVLEDEDETDKVFIVAKSYSEAISKLEKRYENYSILRIKDLMMVSEGSVIYIGNSDTMEETEALLKKIMIFYPIKDE